MDAMLPGPGVPVITMTNIRKAQKFSCISITSGGLTLFVPLFDVACYLLGNAQSALLLTYAKVVYEFPKPVIMLH
jgi:hypothetical protein